MNKILNNFLENNKEFIEEKIERTLEILDVDKELLKSGLKYKEQESIYEKTKYIVFENHPKSINKTYNENMKISIDLALNSLIAFFMYMMHAVFPIFFNNSGTKLLKQNIELTEENNRN
jgi:hypothetical protein